MQTSNAQTRVFKPARCLAVASVISLLAGCELLVEFDRSEIPGSDAEVPVAQDGSVLAPVVEAGFVVVDASDDVTIDVNTDAAEGLNDSGDAQVADVVDGATDATVE